MLQKKYTMNYKKKICKYLQMFCIKILGIATDMASSGQQKYMNTY